MKSLNCFGYTLLKLIFQSSCTEDEKRMLQQGAGLVDLLLTILDSIGRGIICSRPCQILLLRNVSISNAKRAQTIIGKRLHVLPCLFLEPRIMVWSQSLVDDTVSPFAVEDDLSIGTT